MIAVSWSSDAEIKNVTPLNDWLRNAVRWCIKVNVAAEREEK